MTNYCCNLSPQMHTRLSHPRRVAYMNFKAINITLGVSMLVTSLSTLPSIWAQGFINLNFESSNVIGPHEATITGWGTFGFPYGNSSLWYNTISLSAPAVTLHGTNSPSHPPYVGKYQVLLQGGDTSGGLVYNTNGASVFQTAQIPGDAKSIVYWAKPGLIASFSGQRLTIVLQSQTANYSIWRADISAFSGQIGELRFTAPWLSSSTLDNISFSTVQIPEPNIAGFLLLGAFIARKLLHFDSRR
jgi:hypothetical protein